MRVGDWIHTYTGVQFWPLDPREDEIKIEDIAHALSLICRYGGHCKTFYSVAQHSVLVSKICHWRYALAGLLHDATEAYCGDVVRPLKPYLTNYQSIEARLSYVIGNKFGIHFGNYYKQIKKADDTLLCTEVRDIIPSQTVNWKLTTIRKALPGKIVPLSAIKAEALFLERFHYLYGKEQKRKFKI